MKHTNKLGTEPVPSLLLKMSAPAMIGLMVIIIFNIVDAVFVSRFVGTLGIAGLAVVMPIGSLIPIIGMSVGIGAGSMISRHLGAGNKEEADKTLGNAISLTVLLCGTAILLGYLFPDEILAVFGAKEEIVPYAKTYFLIVLAGMPFLGIMMALNNIVRAEGDAKTPMMVLSASAVFNIFLDWLLVVKLNWGIAGSAYATVTSQVIFSSLLFIHVLRGKGVLKFRRKFMRLRTYIVKEIASIGISSLARQSASSVVAMFLNHNLFKYGGKEAVAIYGILNNVLMFLFIPMIGIVQGFLPIAGFNFGAKNFDRLKKSILIALGFGVIAAVISELGGMAFSKAIIRIFTEDKAIVAMGSEGLTIILTLLPLAIIQMIGAAYFQAIGKAMPALLLTLSRQILFLIPMFLVLPKLTGQGLTAIWYSFPAADFLSTCFTLCFFIPEWRKLKANANVKLSVVTE
ncbi:MATE family efflux transporter [Fulvitalea axinellae]|uniref:Multidrug export protein MepA n=1 Tax=Fulvitalea axinellae TaxID=1182444 RepID=A0AAU9CFS8_9BACT|nr:MATE family efflux transporter [Fulvitalea axinellae]